MRTLPSSFYLTKKNEICEESFVTGRISCKSEFNRITSLTVRRPDEQMMAHFEDFKSRPFIKSLNTLHLR